MVPLAHRLLLSCTPSPPSNPAWSPSVPPLLCTNFHPLLSRLKNAALVCKRWQQLCCGPELAERLEVSIDGGEHALPRARSLLAWLSRHGSSVTHLVMLVSVAKGPARSSGKSAQRWWPAA